MQKTSSEIGQYLASIGSIGGKAGTGASKRRGDAAYYKRISKKAAETRKASADRHSNRHTSGK